MRLSIAFYSGSGIGLLIGVLMGTSVTETVGVIIGALAAALAVLLGLDDQHFNEAKAVRIGSFGLACVVGAYLGIYVRSHNLLSPAKPTLAEQAAEYQSLGFTKQETLDFIAPSKPRPATPNAGDAGDAGESDNLASLEHKRTSSLLFGAEVDLDKCAELEGTRADFQLDEVVNNFDIAGGVWRTLAETVSLEIDPPYRRVLLIATRDAFCADGSSGMAKIADADCRQLDERASDYTTRRQQFVTQGGAWQRLASTVDDLNMDERSKAAGLDILARILCMGPTGRVEESP